jgi:hypothetical protein
MAKVELMPTMNTNKNSLALAIGTVAMPALMASLGRIASVNRLDLDTMFTRPRSVQARRIIEE